MKIVTDINPSDFQIGAIIARFQIHELHSAHRGLIEHVRNNHKKVIIFLGVSVIQNTKSNPLDFATRKIMIQEDYPDVVILPLRDQRSNKTWSKILDEQVKMPFGDRTALLYGGRDSFIPYYEGKYKTTELTTDTFVSGTEIRNRVSREIISSKDFRAGVIHATYAQRPSIYQTVDVVAINDKNQILLSKKIDEDKYRFIGGFVNGSDLNFEHSARRIFIEKTKCAISDLIYITSLKVDDWRYNKSESSIMTSLLYGKFIYGRITPSDSLSEIRWFDLDNFDTKLLVDEHKELMQKFLEKYENIRIKT